MAVRLKTVRTVRALRKEVAAWRSRRQPVALVPTMGALHDGHLALVELAHAHAKRVVVSIFVNPAQFAPHEDFEAYPRDESGDRRKLAGAGVDLIYAPRTKEIYPPGFSTRVQVGGVSEGLEGASRPHFFGGVATVVSKLLIQAQPDVAIFGEKDYQQLKVIERLSRDLDLRPRIVGAPIVRETDGLAMSSRNAYLTPEQRVVAPLLFQTITGVASDIADGRAVDEALAAGHARLDAAGFAVDYVEARGAASLQPHQEAGGERLRVLAAALLGRTRLIDNVPVPRRRRRAAHDPFTAVRAR